MTDRPPDTGQRRRFADSVSGPDRPLMAHGPIVRAILVLQALGLVVAASALVLAFVLLSDQVDSNSVELHSIQRSRVLSAQDTCEEFRLVIHAAAATSPPASDKRAKTLAFEEAAGLADRRGRDDCRRRAHRQTALPSESPG